MNGRGPALLTGDPGGILGCGGNGSLFRVYGRTNRLAQESEMDCRQFQKQHALFIDDTLSGVETWSMRDHLTVCESCARQDAQLRRALMIARNSPTVELSAGFRRKLHVRLATERLAHPVGGQARPIVRGASALVAVAAVVLMVGIGLTSRFSLRPQSAMPVVLAPIVVMPPALPTEPVAAPAMFATVSSSLPVYPAMLMAQRATEQFAAEHVRRVSFQAAH